MSGPRTPSPGLWPPDVARFGAASKALRGPFKRLVDKLVLRLRKVAIKKPAARSHSMPSLRENAARSEKILLSRAVVARDTELVRLAGGRSVDRPATIVGAYNLRTGDIGVGRSSKVLDECAEAGAARSAGGDLADIRFTAAKRPNGAGPPFRNVPVCAAYCETAYGRGAFPDPETVFESDLR